VTKPYSTAGDDGGRCESCYDPATIYQSQVKCPVMLGGGMGMGTMWKCRKCAERAGQEPALPSAMAKTFI